jgi:SAM-dependent methyltransferase
VKNTLFGKRLQLFFTRHVRAARTRTSMRNFLPGLLLAAGAHARPGPGPEVGALYEELYSKHKYHSDLTFSHGKEIARKISKEKGHLYRSVLDVGCSHGFSVQLLWSLGINASGVDISPTAVAIASRARGDGNGMCGGDGVCFKPGSATALPFPSQSFDAIMSTEVLEHLLPEDVPQAVAEFSRVARHALFLKIAGHKEAGGQFLHALKQGNSRFRNVKNLHTAILEKAAWLSAFKSHGWVQDNTLQLSERWERDEVKAGNSVLYLKRRARQAGTAMGTARATRTR